MHWAYPPGYLLPPRKAEMKTEIHVTLESHPATGSVEKVEAMLNLFLEGLYGVRDYSVEVTSDDV